MFSQTWSKYMPVIRILIKRSASTEQTLNMNSTDFMRATGGKKIKFSFEIHLINGRLRMTDKQTPLAKEFALILQEDEQVRNLLKGQEFEFSMNNSCQLTIRNNSSSAVEADIASGDNSESTDNSTAAEDNASA
jgi:hypothetical protein